MDEGSSRGNESKNEGNGAPQARHREKKIRKLRAAGARKWKRGRAAGAPPFSAPQAPKIGPKGTFPKGNTGLAKKNLLRAKLIERPGPE